MTEPTPAELRNQAIDCSRAEDWAGLLELEQQLRADTDYWIQIWGPSCAIAARILGRPDAMDLLAECVRDGFFQLENLGARYFEQAFGADPGWAELRAAIRSNVPPPPLELLRWPSASPFPPLQLARLDPAGAEMLASRLPERLPSAWATAEQLLRWVTNRWHHNGINHDDSGDANVVLDRVERGERFACLEYGVVLTQALNAMQIPARRISLFRAGYHAEMGGGHPVTEAWIDDLGSWVVLDGQNGAVWRDDQGSPLGVIELQARYLAGDQPTFDGTGPNFRPEAASEWFSYFYAAAVRDGLAWSPGPYVPVLEGRTVVVSDRLVDSDADAAPDLAAIGTGVTRADGPALVFHAAHPYASGFEVAGQDGQPVMSLSCAVPFRLSKVPGDYELTVAARTPYAVLMPHALDYRVR